MSGSTKRMVLVAGNIGSGKTSLTERLGQRLGWKTAYESVEDNPYLGDFYADMRAWAFHLQIFFLGHRAHMHLALARDPRSAIVDRSIYEDAEIFARASLELGNVTRRDYDSYRTVYQLVIDALPAPDLLLFLKAPVSVLMRRIRERARDIEKGITPEYLSLLDRYYEDWLGRFAHLRPTAIFTHVARALCGPGPAAPTRPSTRSAASAASTPASHTTG